VVDGAGELKTSRARHGINLRADDSGPSQR